MNSNKKFEQSIIKTQSLVRKWLVLKNLPKQNARSLERLHHMHELLKTEESFIENLTILVNYIMIPLLSFCKTNQVLITKQKVAHLFGNLEEILKFHQNFYKDLLHSHQNYWQSSLSSVFDKYFNLKDLESQESVVIMYSQYLANYEKGQRVLNILNEDDVFVDLLEQLIDQIQLDNPQIRFFHLPSFLITPAQRFPRYSLLLKSIIKSTDTFHKDYNSLVEVESQMNEFCNRVDVQLEKMKQLKKKSALNAKTTPPINKDKAEISRLPRSPSSGQLHKLSKERISSFNELPKTPPKPQGSPIPSYMKPTISSSMKMKEAVKGKEEVQSPRWKGTGVMQSPPPKPIKKEPLTPKVKVRVVPAKYPSSVSAPTSPTRLRPVSNY